MKSLIFREKIYVPVDDVEEYRDSLNNLFTIDLFKEENCESCEERDTRPNDVCTDCQSYIARKKLWRTVTKDGQPYVGLPFGDLGAIKSVFPRVGSYEIQDLRPVLPFKTDLTFTGELRPHQLEACDILTGLADKDKLRGVLRAPARSGKTVLAIALACKLRLRTLILANTHPLCAQFYATCVGGENQPALTNAKTLEADTGNPPVVLAATEDDFLNGDIVISTYQKFISEKGKERLAKIASKFSLVIIDEVHKAPATTYMKVVANLNARCKLGLTATEGRKDGMNVLNNYVLGKRLHAIEVETLIPEIVFHETGLFPKTDYSNWTYYCRWLERQEDRTQQIIDRVIADVKDGKSVVIPCIFTSQISELVRRINTEYGRTIAAEVVGGPATKASKAKREETLDKARDGTIKVIVGTRSIIGTGVNVPLWEVLYWINPLSNPPNWVQEYSRILTPLKGKKPLIRMFLDGSAQTRGCLKTCLFSTEGDTKPLAKQAIIKPEQWATANRYLRRGAMNPDLCNKTDAAQKDVVMKNGRTRKTL